MHKFLTAFLIALFGVSWAQVTVPYRIGDRFGIADENGKLLIPVTFDVIDVHAPGEFTATKRSANGFKTTYITDNKIRLSDTEYNYFNLDSSFITAVKLKNTGDFGADDSRNSVTDVYTLSGRKVFGQSYRFVNFIEDEKKPALKDEILILTNDLNGKYSLLLLNKKTMKVTRTFFENAVDVDTDYDRFPVSFNVKYVLARETTLNQLTITFENGRIKTHNSEPVSPSSGFGRSVSESYSSYSPPPPPHAFAQEGIKSPPIIPEQKNDNIALEIKMVELNKRYTEPFTDQTMTLVSHKLTKEYANLVKVDGKWGYFGNQTKNWILAPSYDEIILDEGKCVFCSTYVVRVDGVYRIIETENSKQKTYPGKFVKFPHFAKKDFGREGFQLIRLFDEDGKFFAYANQDGKVYYSR